MSNVTNIPNHMDSPSQYHNHPSVQLSRMLFQQYTVQCICYVARLGISDILQERPMLAAELAGRTNNDETGLYRILRHMASVGIFVENEHKVFSNSPMSSSLRREAPDSVLPLVMLLEEDWHRCVWDNLAMAVETGESAFDRLFGSNLFHWVADKPEAANVLLAFAAAFSADSFPPILQSYDFSKVRTLIDIGAGLGNDIAMLLAAYPAMQATCFELPLPIERARDNLRHKQCYDRVRFESGDMFGVIPEGGDLYLLKQICHNWSDAHVHRLLRTCRQAMNGRGTLLVAEFIVDSGTPMDTAFAKLIDVWMMVLTSGGRNRTLAEHRRNLEEGGFTVARIIPTGSPQTIIEAFPNS